MRVLLFDTEISGLPLWSLPSEDPSQPHLCQFTAVVFDDQTGEEHDYVDMLIKPDGWTIPEELTAIHGISQERAEAEGQPEKDAVTVFQNLLRGVERVSGFNVDFDLRIMRIAIIRAGYTKEEADEIAAWIKPRKHDVMFQSAPICKLPPTEKQMARGIRGFKQPKLSEAVQCILGETMADAHDARADVLATKRLYEALNPPPTVVVQK